MKTIQLTILQIKRLTFGAICCISIFFLHTPLNSVLIAQFTNGYDLEINPYFSSEEREAVRRYLLPRCHPIKYVLDSIFHAHRATQDERTMEAAGFSIKYKKVRSYISVASHPCLIGYLIKAHLDNEERLKKGRPGWKWFVNRIRGANKIRKAIQDMDSQLFVVPNKWIYPLPENPGPAEQHSSSRKNVILIVTDMNLVSQNNNYKAWKEKITKEHLEQFYAIIKFSGGSSYRPDNVWYTREGKFAFIDTEYPDREPNLNSIRHFLSDDMKIYWDEIIK